MFFSILVYGIWQATGHGVAKSQPQLSMLLSSPHFIEYSSLCYRAITYRMFIHPIYNSLHLLTPNPQPLKQFTATL